MEQERSKKKKRVEEREGGTERRESMSTSRFISSRSPADNRLVAIVVNRPTYNRAFRSWTEGWCAMFPI